MTRPSLRMYWLWIASFGFLWIVACGGPTPGQEEKKTEGQTQGESNKESTDQEKAPEITTEVANETQAEATPEGEKAGESAKEGQGEASKEASKEASTEGGQEVAKEGQAEASKEATAEASKEGQGEIATDTTTEGAGETNADTTSETLPEDGGVETVLPRCQIDPAFGQPCSEGNGPCKTVGVRVCAPDGLSLVCDAKPDLTKAQPEVCNGQDDDCDGSIDNAPSDAGKSCQVAGQQGVCADGRTACVGAKIECQAQATPSPETCDGKDNDCNGKIDDTFPDQGKACKVAGQQGPCADSTFVCNNGQVECPQVTQPAPEACDGKDNDCNGQIDDTFPEQGLSCQVTGTSGPCVDGIRVCKQGQLECQSKVQPSPEACDGKDNDCNGQIDDTFPEQGQACQVAGQKGLCADSKRACVNGQLACPQTVQPAAEICDGKDNNCDGQIDENTDEGCYTGPAGTEGVGVCKKGTRRCVNGQFQACTGEVLPSPEICDGGLDNNCDGKVDENCTCTNGRTQPCGSDVGECKKGTQTCANGQWGPCSGEIPPAPEMCDNKDNDCDGKIDETLSQDCYTGPSGTANVGNCKSGRQICTGGLWGTCTGQILPAKETCDGKDEDCDGRIDNGITRTCYTGAAGCTLGANGAYSCVGLCRSGTQTCNNGTFGACVGEVTPKTEDCNGQDDDCDGRIDEGLTIRRCYTGPAGTQDIGRCRSGTQICSGGQWTTCANQVLPTTEVCNAQDDDCDGKVDEALTRACYTGLTGCTSTPNGSYNCVGECKSGTQTCQVGFWGACQNQTTPQAEICDGKDNDCDGQIDDTPSGINQRCTVPNQQGTCAAGSTRCTGGQLICTQTVQPVPEICTNSLDDDCDGRINNGCFRAFLANADDVLVVETAPGDNPATGYTIRGTVRLGQPALSVDLNPFLVAGKNTVRFRLNNLASTYAYTVILYDGSTELFRDSCGIAGTPGAGCNNNSTQTGAVYSKTVVITK